MSYTNKQPFYPQPTTQPEGISINGLLLFGYGNPGRGDDALGPLFVDKIAQLNLVHISYQAEMQLSIEHVTDLDSHAQTVFVDADVSCAAPFVFSTIYPQKDDSYTSHALTPSALLYVYQQIFQRSVPAAFLLRIRGYRFALGDNLSQQAIDNLDAALQFFRLHYSL